MRKVKTLVAKNPSEARGIRKALKAMNVKFEFTSAGKGTRHAKANPKKKRARKAKRKKARRRR